MFFLLSCMCHLFLLNVSEWNTFARYWTSSCIPRSKIVVVDGHFVRSNTSFKIQIRTKFSLVLLALTVCDILHRCFEYQIQGIVTLTRHLVLSILITLISKTRNRLIVDLVVMFTLAFSIQNKPSFFCNVTLCEGTSRCQTNSPLFSFLGLKESRIFGPRS